MGGCCGAMKTGQKSLPENKHGKVDGESKHTEKDSPANTNNKTTAVGNEKLNHADANPEVKQETAKVANGVDQKDPGSNPGVAVNGATVEEEVATKIVTQAMEAALAETNGGASLEQQTSVTGSAGGVSDDEALREWMKSDTNNALVIDEAPLESAVKSEVQAAAPAVQLGDISVTVPAESREIAEEFPADTGVGPVSDSETETVSHGMPDLPPFETIHDSSFSADEHVPETSEVIHTTSAEPQISEEQVESPKIEDLPPPELSNEIQEEPVNREPENFEAVPPEVLEQLEFSDAAVVEPIPAPTDEAEASVDTLPTDEETAVINSENIVVPNETIKDSTDAVLTSYKEVPPLENIEEPQAPAADFDAEILPPPPAQDFTNEPVMSSPEFDAVPPPPPEDTLPEEIEQSTSEIITQSEPTEDLAAPAEEFVTDKEPLQEQKELSERRQEASEAPEDAPILEEVVQEANEQRNEWWSDSQQQPEGEVPSTLLESGINGTNGVEEASLESSEFQAPHDEFPAPHDEFPAPLDEGSIPNSQPEDNLEVTPLPAKAALQENLVPSTDAEVNGVNQGSGDANVSTVA